MSPRPKSSLEFVHGSRLVSDFVTPSACNLLRSIGRHLFDDRESFSDVRGLLLDLGDLLRRLRNLWSTGEFNDFGDLRDRLFDFRDRLFNFENLDGLIEQHRSLRRIGYFNFFGELRDRLLDFRDRFFNLKDLGDLVQQYRSLGSIDDFGDGVVEGDYGVRYEQLRFQRTEDFDFFSDFRDRLFDFGDWFFKNLRHDDVLRLRFERDVNEAHLYYYLQNYSVASFFESFKRS